MQRERRRDPYPWTWEIPLGIAVGGLLLTTVGIQLARSLANLVAGAGWTWPSPPTASSPNPFPSPLGSAFWNSLPGILTGHAEAGLSQPPPPSHVATPEVLWACLIVTELLLLTGCGWAGARGYQRWGPSRMKGMATAAEAETLLGLTRLRHVARYVRPDLHDRSVTTQSATQSANLSSPVSGPTAGRDANSNIAVRHARSPWVLPGRRFMSRDSEQ